MKFGKRTVVGEAYSKACGNWYYDCVCECGDKSAVRIDDLKHGRSRACRTCTNSPFSSIERFTVKWRAHPHRSLPGKGPCWEWTAKKAGNRGKKGLGRYGKFWLNGKEVQAHRFSYEHYIGPIPEGLELDHLCGYKPCVNPLHLEAVTHLENVRRCGSTAGTTASVAIRAAMTHCGWDGKGLHEWTEENTLIDNRGNRLCRACNSARNRRNYAKRKASNRWPVDSAAGLPSRRGTSFA